MPQLQESCIHVKYFTPSLKHNLLKSKASSFLKLLLCFTYQNIIKKIAIYNILEKRKEKDSTIAGKSILLVTIIIAVLVVFHQQCPMGFHFLPLTQFLILFNYKKIKPYSQLKFITNPKKQMKSLKHKNKNKSKVKNRVKLKLKLN